MTTRTLAFALAVLSLCGLVLEGCTLPPVPELKMEGGHGGGAGGNVQDAATPTGPTRPAFARIVACHRATAAPTATSHRQTPPSTANPTAGLLETHLRWTPETAPCKTALR